jgi:hypothetical protein
VPLSKLQFQPGINRDKTNYANEGGWYDCDKVRFREGYPQKIGGWEKVSSISFLGVCRDLWNWSTTFNDNLLSIPTHRKLYIEAGSIFYDITPIRETFDTLTDPIETTSGSNEVILSIPIHGAASQAFVIISGVTESIGGIPANNFNKSHEITVVDDNSVKIFVDTEADATTSGGSSATFEFEINPGSVDFTAGYGWGVPSWGGEPETEFEEAVGWGLGGKRPIFFDMRDWFSTNLDNDLIANIRTGPIYYWSRGTDSNVQVALNDRAVLLSSLPDSDAVPTLAGKVIVSQLDRHIIAFGAQPFGGDNIDYDPMLVRWSNQDDPINWSPSPTNSAGFFRLSKGSRIVTAVDTRQEILVFTDNTLYGMQFLGTTDVFGFEEYSENISIASPRAVISVNNLTFWMGKNKFYMYSGRVDTLDCKVREYVFQDFNEAQTGQVVCGTNEKWSEVWWFYPSSGSLVNDRYVVYNYKEGVWYFGKFDKTAWLESGLRPNPHSVITDENSTFGFLYRHEEGVDADGEPMDAYITSADFDIDDGEYFGLLKRIIPDVSFAGSSVNDDIQPQITLEVKPRNFPGASFAFNPDSSQPVISTTIEQFTNQVFIRARARQMAIKVSSNTLGVYWQLGDLRLDFSRDGKR